MIVSHARRFIFFHNPKCAGTSFRETLAPYHDDPVRFWDIFPAPYFRNKVDYAHLRLWELQQLFPRVFECAGSYVSAIFVRNPYDRFLSAIEEHFKWYQPQIPLAQRSPAQQAQIIERFVAQILNVGHVMTDWRCVHFSPQIWHLLIGERVVPTHIIPMIEGEDYFGRAFDALGVAQTEVLWRNRSPARRLHLLDSPRIEQFVREFYQPDFEFFESRPELAPLTRKPETRTAQAV